MEQQEQPPKHSEKTDPRAAGGVTSAAKDAQDATTEQSDAAFVHDVQRMSGGVTNSITANTAQLSQTLNATLDRLTSSIAERDGLKRKVAEQEIEIATLRTDLDTAKGKPKPNTQPVK